jgi:hypothetical protein
MPIRVEAYTAEGVATGVVAGHGPLRERLDGGGALLIEGSRWLPLDGFPERFSGDLDLPVDDILFAVADEPDGTPVHAQWHAIELDAGPYRVRGEMPTMPGFDPGRALARPTGDYVLLREGRITLIDRDDAGEATADRLLVNRYTVDRVACDLMLGFFFPGAAMTITGSPAGTHTAGTEASDEPAAMEASEDEGTPDQPAPADPMPPSTSASLPA